MAVGLVNCKDPQSIPQSTWYGGETQWILAVLMAAFSITASLSSAQPKFKMISEGITVLVQSVAGIFLLPE